MLISEWIFRMNLSIFGIFPVYASLVGYCDPAGAIMYNQLEKTTGFRDWIGSSKELLAALLLHRNMNALAQWSFFSRTIGKVTPEIMYFYYLKTYFKDQSIQKKTFNLIFKKASLLLQLGLFKTRPAPGPAQHSVLQLFEYGRNGELAKCYRAHEHAKRPQSAIVGLGERFGADVQTVRPITAGARSRSKRRTDQVSIVVGGSASF